MRLDLDHFLQLSSSEIADLIDRENRPKLGVFVPDGSRRMVLTLTDVEPDSAEFF